MTYMTYETAVHRVDSDEVVQTLGDVGVGVDENGAWMIVTVLGEGTITLHLQPDQLRDLAHRLTQAAQILKYAEHDDED